MRKLLSLLSDKKTGPGHYEKEKNIALSGDTKKRLSLAGNTKTHKEILYYLAEKDPDPKVRKAVAENPAMPVHVSTVLAADKDVDVRLALARRLIQLLPELSADRQSQLYAFAVQSLATLALDEVLKIRRALSSALKDHADTPPDVAGKLARDIEREVSEPILRFCAALADEDLLDVLKGHPESWAVQAVAARDNVSESVSQAVIDTGDAPAGKILLENESANISAGLLEEIVSMAKTMPEWQAPVATHKNLPVELALELADFAEEEVRGLLARRGDFDEEVVEEISAAFHRRLEYAAGKSADDSDDPVKRARRLCQEGRLDEEMISDALGMRDRDFVMAAIACLARISLGDMNKIIDMKAPRPLVAVCWKAGLSMRMALRAQKEIAHIPPKELVYPKGGTDYPLAETDLTWQLDFLGLHEG